MLPAIAHCSNIKKEDGGRVLRLRDEGIKDKLHVGIKIDGNISIVCYAVESPWKIVYETSDGVVKREAIQINQTFSRVNMSFAPGGWMLILRTGRKVDLESLAALGKEQRDAEMIAKDLTRQSYKAVIVIKY